MTRGGGSWRPRGKRLWRAVLLFALVLASSLPFALFVVVDNNHGGEGLDNSHVRRFMIVHTSTLVPDLKGGDLRIYQVILALRQMGHEVTYCFMRTEVPELTSHRHTLHLLDLGVDILGPVADNLELLRFELGSQTYFAVLEWLWPNPTYLYALFEGINVIFALCSRETAIVVVSDDNMAARLGEETQFDGQNGFVSRSMLADVEHRFWQRADVVAAVSKPIVDIVHKVAPRQTTKLLRFALELEYQDVQPSSKADVLWFGYNNPSNRMAVDFIVTSLREAEGKGGYPFVVHIVGGVEDMGCKVQRGCEYHGALSEDELKHFLERTRWVIAPIFASIGVSTKIIKALSHGVPVLTTQFGVEYFPKRYGGRGPIAVAKNEDFFEVLSELYANSREYESRRQKIIGFAEEEFSMRVMKRDLEKIARAVLDRARATENIAHKSQPPTLRWSITVDLDIGLVEEAIAESFMNAFKRAAEKFDVVPNNQCQYRIVDAFITLQAPSRPTCCPRHRCQFIVWHPVMMPAPSTRQTWLSRFPAEADEVWFPSTSVALNFHRNVHFPRHAMDIIPFGALQPSSCKHLKSTLNTSTSDVGETDEAGRPRFRVQHAMTSTDTVYLYFHQKHTSLIEIHDVIDSWCAAIGLETAGTFLLVALDDMSTPEASLLRLRVSSNLVGCARVIISLAHREDQEDDFMDAADVLIHLSEDGSRSRTFLDAVGRGFPIVVLDKHLFDDYWIPDSAVSLLSSEESRPPYLQVNVEQKSTVSQQLELALRHTHDSLARRRFLAGFGAIDLCRQFDLANLVNVARNTLETSLRTRAGEVPLNVKKWTTPNDERPELFRIVIENEGALTERCLSCSSLEGL